VTLLAVAIGVLGLVGWVVDVAASAPDISHLKPRDPGQVSEVYSRDGQLMGYIHSDILRTVVPYSQIPLILRRATVAIEDRRFWTHGGIDPQGILRAAIKDVFGGGRNIQGGSTLTMQLVRNIYLPYRLADTRSLKRKIIEAKLAEELESKRTKTWILTQYMNDVDYGTVGGQTAIGVGAASRLFFDKPVSQLDLAQSALLAGLPQAPSEYNPFLRPKLARQRRHDVLMAMVNSHYITPQQAARADASHLQVKPNNTYSKIAQPFIFDYVKQQLIQRFGRAAVDRGGMKVYTTIDPRRQAEALQALLSHEGGSGQPAAALVSIDPTNGQIEAMATTSKYGTGPGETTFDYAWQGHRQTGSAFKVFTLMTLIHDFNGDPDQTYYNSHLLAPGWLPGYPTYSVHTAELSYQGNISVTHATTVSDNTVFAQLAQDVTVPKVTATAHAMGITSPLTNFPSEALGAVSVSPLEMADAYATLASGGIHHPATAITKVVFPDGSVANLGEQPGKRVFPYGQVFAADQVLKTVITSGTGTAASYGCPAAGKTGTTTSFTDAYFAGYTPQLATAVWVGYPDATTSMPGGFGGTLAAPIWHDYMAQASNGYCSDFPQPTDPFHGTAFFGRFATTGGGGGGSSGSGTSSGSGSSSGSSGSGTVSPYYNHSLYAQPPQPATPSGGAGNGGGGNSGRGNAGGGAKPPGFGGGHAPGSGGSGIKTH
jgi:penicillin-binding protein 1A